MECLEPSQWSRDEGGVGWRDHRDEAPSRVTPGRPFQILSLDGGGYRGLFSAAVLAAFEEDLGRPVVEHFDLVTGTSTGGIIALALGAGLSPRQVIEFYETHGSRIFA